MPCRTELSIQQASAVSAYGQIIKNRHEVLTEDPHCPFILKTLTKSGLVAWCGHDKS